MRDGFTLIEILIVVMIIGLLGSMAVPRYMEATKEAKVSEARIILKHIWEAQRQYYLEFGTYSPPVEDVFDWERPGYTDRIPAHLCLDCPSGRQRFQYDILDSGAARATVLPYERSMAGVPPVHIDPDGKITGGNP